MSNIHFPVDNPPVPPTAGKNKSRQPLQHTDPVNEDPQQQGKQSAKKSRSQLGKPDQSADINDNSTTVPHDHVARSKDRRKANRRKKNQPVLLDTRTGQDRRKTHGQRKDDVITEDSTFGIDTEA